MLQIATKSGSNWPLRPNPGARFDPEQWLPDMVLVANLDATIFGNVRQADQICNLEIFHPHITKKDNLFT